MWMQLQQDIMDRDFKIADAKKNTELLLKAVDFLEMGLDQCTTEKHKAWREIDAIMKKLLTMQVL